MNKKMNRSKILRFSVVILFLIGLVTLTGSVSARTHMGFHQARQTLEQGSTIDGPGFFSGDFVQVDGDVDGTTFVSGNQIQINGDINGSLFVAGRSIQINGEINGNIYGLGTRIQMRGQNEGEVFFAGETITIEQDAEPGRDMFIAGMDVMLEGDVPRHLFAVGEFITLNGAIGGDATINSESLMLGDSASIDGNLSYEGPEEADMSPTATVAGQTEFNQRDTWDMAWNWNVSQQERWQFRLLFALWSILSALVVWFMIKLLKPLFWIDNALPISTKPLLTLGLGALALIATPFILVLLMITLIGIPMSFILAMLYGIALYISRIIVALFIGASIFRLFGKPNFDNEFLLVLIGLFIVELVMLIPYVGWIFGFFIVITGLGALILSGRQTTGVEKSMF
ncbi:hypothetical protein [Alkalibacterium sp. 20]|uniref:hypothetical protein n=1 Tax=Alkalibacterium sp. 20 TaxID=1798803 RepID=UPI0009002EA4|nr:hypothetical protein [Alkalibacterium sp. 20]OJF89902.1 hypothetical protein AX762_11995 [Alkalibacterium sp. 20]